MARRSSTPTVTATMTMMTSNKSVCWAEPEWPAPPQVRSLITRRHGGVSQSPYDSANLALHVGDDVGGVDLELFGEADEGLEFLAFEVELDRVHASASRG